MKKLRVKVNSNPTDSNAKPNKVYTVIDAGNCYIAKSRSYGLHIAKNDCTILECK